MVAKVGIVAVAQTKYSPDRCDVNEEELAWEAIKPVLEETGLSLWDIASAVSCSQDFWDGRTISNMNVQHVVGAHLQHEDKVCEDGINAVFIAMGQILSGHHDVILLVSHMKESQGEKSVIENAAFDPAMMRQLGLDFTSAAALQARRYMYKYGVTARQCAGAVVRNYANAKNNPCAQNAEDLTIDDVLGSGMVAAPIRALDAKPISDGAVAMILATEEKAKQICKKPVWIRGVSNCYETHYLGDRELADCDALATASRKAYGMAGIKNPAKEIDLVEISTEYSYQEPLWLEGLGFCGRGEGGDLVNSRAVAMGGKLPVNPSGGMLPGVPNGVSGLARVAECTLQLRGEAGERQVKGASTALAHGYTGMCGQHQSVVILGN
ncbi:MAG: thiolase family protein [Dehalococcoidia bacterium]